MSDYIDRQKLKEAFREDAINSLSCYSNDLMDLIISEIDEAPSEDVRPVVCGECANAYDVGDNLVRCDIFDRDMMPNDFCSCFEPKGDEQNE